MNLTDIVPRESTFKLRSVKDKIFTMRPINLGDEIWIENEYPNNRFQDIIENINIKELSRIVFRLLINEDKLFLKKQKVTVVGEDGEELEEEKGGVELLRTMISGWDEKGVILNALLENIGLSREIILGEIEAAADGEKKSKKKQIGEKS